MSPKNKESRTTRLKNHEAGNEIVDILHEKSSIATECANDGCKGSIIAAKNRVLLQHETKPHDDLLSEAEDFIKQYYEHKERVNTDDHRRRWDDVKSSIEFEGTYTLLKDELVFGARTAWRNASRCIGRIQWSNLEIFDARDCQTVEGMFEHICNHLEYATNGGNVRSTITVFKQRVGSPENDFRIWNHQLIHYAGYRMPDGSVIGDPSEEEFTKICQNLGWKGSGGHFDVLPLVLQAKGEDPKLFEIPKHLAMEIQLKHPKHEWFQALGLKWYAVPAISSIMLDVGGLQFPAAPFNGWYMQSEIARDFCDAVRYNLLEPVARRLGLDTKSNYSLWKDEAFVEFNKTILYSYREAGVTVIDHHSASDSFMSHLSNEQRLRGGCPGDWVWVVPPIGGSLCKVWHQEMLNYHLRPSYEYMNDPWRTHVWADKEIGLKFKTTGSRSLFSFRSCAFVVMFTLHLSKKTQRSRPGALVLYATETGKSERYARQAYSVFQRLFNTRVMCMADYDVANIGEEKLILIVASTFGNGDPPTDGTSFYGHMQELFENGNRLERNKYGIFALGSSAYPKFCNFGKNMDKIMSKLGAERIIETGTGDEVCGEVDNFREWLMKVFQNACNHFDVKLTRVKDENDNTAPLDGVWTSDNYQLVGVDREVESQVNGLSLLHRREVTEAEFLSMSNLHKTVSQRDMTVFIRLKVDENKITYAPGDHVALFSKNDTGMVNAILERLDDSINVDQPVMLERRTQSHYETVDTSFRNRVLPVCSVRNALKSYLDITSPPQPAFLSCLAKMTESLSDRHELNILAKGEEAYLKWRMSKQPSLIDVLNEFRSLTLNPSVLMAELPLLQPRLYSISSSQASFQDEIHLTVSLVNYLVHDSTRPVRKGVASSWLSEIPHGTRIQIYIKPAPEFHLPIDPKVPAIFIATGSGIAPFRSFWQELAKKIGDKQEYQIPGDVYDNSLVYGCRTRDRHLYKDEIEHAKTVGALKETTVVYSREPKIKKKYVQDVLEENGEHYANKIVSHKAHIYVCGAVQLADGVQDAIANILKQHKGYTTEKARTYIDVMKKTHRYHENVFGLMPNANFRKESRKRSTKESPTCTLF